MKASGMRSLIVLGVLATAACGDDSTSPLNETEAQQLASAVLTTAFSVFGMAQTGAPLRAAGPALVPYNYDFSWDGTVDCPGGGSVAADASVITSGDSETGAAEVEMEFTQIHSDCVVQSSGQPFTFNGSPSVVVAISYETDGEGIASYTGSIQGALDYEYDGRSDTCPIDYNYTGTTNTVTGASSYSLDGNVCGVGMTYSYNVG